MLSSVKFQGLIILLIKILFQQSSYLAYHFCTSRCTHHARGSLERIPKMQNRFAMSLCCYFLFISFVKQTQNLFLTWFLTFRFVCKWMPNRTVIKVTFSCLSLKISSIHGTFLAFEDCWSSIIWFHLCSAHTSRSFSWPLKRFIGLTMDSLKM